MSGIVCSINQPYFFPYYGFFVLLANSDVFISLDDVNMRKKGFINRNLIINQEQKYQFTVPLKRVSQNKLINNTYVLEPAKFLNKFRRLLRDNYRKAFYYYQLEAIMDEMEGIQTSTISELALHSIKLICVNLGIKTMFFSSSDFDIQGEKGQYKIIKLCNILGASTYLNLPSGKNLYNHRLFKQNGLNLQFLNYKKNSFVSMLHEDGTPLSILDTITKFSFEEISGMINEVNLEPSS